MPLTRSSIGTNGLMMDSTNTSAPGTPHAPHAFAVAQAGSANGAHDPETSAITRIEGRPISRRRAGANDWRVTSRRARCVALHRGPSTSSASWSSSSDSAFRHSSTTVRRDVARRTPLSLHPRPPEPRRSPRRRRSSARRASSSNRRSADSSGSSARSAAPGAPSGRGAGLAAGAVVSPDAPSPPCVTSPSCRDPSTTSTSFGRSTARDCAWSSQKSMMSSSNRTTA